MSFEDAVNSKAEKRWFWRYFAPYFMAMFKNWAFRYLQTLSEDEKERFKASWLSS